jgi:hypothetical protein
MGWMPDTSVQHETTTSATECMSPVHKSQDSGHSRVLPQHINIPHLSTAEPTIQAARELTRALRNLVHEAPFVHIGHDWHEALARLGGNFEEIADPEGPPPVSLTITVVPSSVAPSAAPSTGPTPPRVLMPGQAPLPRLSTPLTSPHTIHRISPSPRTLIPPPVFDLYKQRRHTI